MYEKEKEILRKLSNTSVERKYELLERAYKQLERASNAMFASIDPENILDYTSQWAMDCDGSYNTLEHNFKWGYIRMSARLTKCIPYNDIESKKNLYNIIELAKHIVRRDDKKRNSYTSFVDAISVIFGVFAVADGIITDDTAKALNELSKHG